MRESSNGVQALGTTKRGIGPAYEDKVGRRAIRVVDLADFAILPGKIERLLAASQRAAARQRRSPRSTRRALLESA